MKIGSPIRSNSDVGVRSAAAISKDLQHALKMELEYSGPAVYEIDPLRDPRWAALVESHPRSSVFHSTSWLRALHTVYGYEPVGITTCPPGASLTNGLVLCSVKSWLTGRRFVSLPFSDHCEALLRNSSELDDLLLHMKQYVETGEWKYIEIRPTSYEPGSHTGLGRSTTYSLHRLDL